jgi:hypothetical protein
MSSNGFTFANPTYTADNFFTYSAGNIEGDASLQATQVIEPIPAPRVDPPVLDLSGILSAQIVAQIQASGSLVFHSVGDTGGIVRAEPQLSVADALEADLTGKTYSTGQPAFFYHLGDVVYYFGQQEFYPEQFYDPYRNYAGPIFAIPGNHDGVEFAKEPISFSLEPFVNNFCAASPTVSVPGFARTTMTQPGAYFVLTAPFARIIGLYSNTGESVGVLSNTTIGDAQITFLNQQLAAALAARQADTANKNPQALILAVHHPPFTGSSQHFPSAAMLAQIDSCCQAAGIWPDLVLSGHAHLYERYTRTMKADGRQIPYVVAGNGGYYNLSKMKVNSSGAKPTASQHSEPDGQGNTITLDQFNDTEYGFLRITVNARQIQVDSLAVKDTQTTTTPTTPIPPPTLIDSFTVTLSSHVVSSVGQG